MIFLVDAAPYIEKYPHVTSIPHGEWGGNAVLETSEYLVIKNEICPDKSDKNRINDVFHDAKVKYGRISRGSHKKNDPQRHDDYIGLVVAASILGVDEIPKEIYHYGKKHFWNYRLHNSLSEWFNGFFLRMPGVVQTFKMANNKKLNLFDQFWLSLKLIGNVLSPTRSTSGRKLSRLMIKLYEHKKLDYFFINKTIKLWKWDIKRRYPKLFKDVYTIYYFEDHLFSEYSEGKF